MKSYHLLLLIAIALGGCNQPHNPEADLKNNDGSYKYDFTEKKFSDFIVEKSDERELKPYLVTYGFKGGIRNNTENIYEKAFIELETIITLNNGNQLNCSELNYAKDLIGSGVFSSVKSNWKPDETWQVDAIHSCSLSTDYFDYPIKKIYMQVYLKLQDQINNSKKEILLSQVDVTEKWKNAENKFRKNKSDCTDSQLIDFLKKK